MRLLVRFIASTPIAFIQLLRFPLFVVMYYLVGYRKKVILTNLTRAFPNKGPKNLKSIQKEFVFHFTEFLLEFLILFKGKARIYEDRVHIKNWKLIENKVQSGKHVIIAMGHQGNWEFAAVRMSQLLNVKMTGIYKKINNPKLEDLVFNARSKFGLHLFEMKDSVKGMLRMRKTPAAHLFIMDQSPRKNQSNRWINFLNQDTCILEGVEKMSKALEAEVVWLSVTKTGFARYEMEVKALDQNHILENCYKQLAQNIHDQPHTWLWSHRRWKLKR